MKIARLFVGLMFIFVLSACSLIEDVNQSLDYVDQTTDYLNSLNDLGNEVPQLVEDAAKNPEIKQELENQLTTIKDEITAFNELEAPQLAKDIHQQIVEKNEQITSVINQVVTDGQVAVEKLEQSELLQLIKDVSSLLNQLENLGLN